MWAIFVATALAEPRFAVGAGVEAVVNDPFVHRRGLRYGFTYAPAQALEVGVSGGWYPSLGQGGCADPDWSAEACELLEEAQVSPDISKLVSQGQVTLRILPLRARVGRWETAVGLLAGAGIVGTQDDLVALQNDDESAVVTQNQVHPSTVIGWLGEVREEHLGVRIRMERVQYIEVVNSSTLEMKGNLFAGAEVMWWF